MLLLTYDRDEVIEVLVEIDSFRVIESVFFGERLQLFWVSSRPDVNREVFYVCPEGLSVDLGQ